MSCHLHSPRGSVQPEEPTYLSLPMSFLSLPSEPQGIRCCLQDAVQEQSLDFHRGTSIFSFLFSVSKNSFQVLGGELIRNMTPEATHYIHLGIPLLFANYQVWTWLTPIVLVYTSYHVPTKIRSFYTEMKALCAVTRCCTQGVQGEAKMWHMPPIPRLRWSVEQGFC